MNQQQDRLRKNWNSAKLFKLAFRHLYCVTLLQVVEWNSLFVFCYVKHCYQSYELQVEYEYTESCTTNYNLKSQYSSNGLLCHLTKFSF